MLLGDFDEVFNKRSKCKKIVAKFLKITFRNVKITSKRGKKIEKTP